MNFTDVEIMSFVDDDCDDQLKQKIENQLRNDFELAKRIEKFQRTNNTMGELIKKQEEMPIELLDELKALRTSSPEMKKKHKIFQENYKKSIDIKTDENIVKNSPLGPIERITEKGGNWIILIKSATNVLKGDNFVFVYPELMQNKIIVRRGEVITSEILEKKDLDFENINSKINTMLKKTRDKIKSRGSIVKEITTKGDFIKKFKDSINTNKKNKYLLEVVSLKDSKTAESIIVELNINKI